MGINGTWVHSSKIIPPKLKKKKKIKIACITVDMLLSTTAICYVSLH